MRLVNCQWSVVSWMVVLRMPAAEKNVNGQQTTRN